ncbi:MAG TPA: PD-(D/E)XK nuclease family protein [Burkholderiaceae bacterium]|nr:PD-(D/E)XK nuclease family protein [Burkholderiaceae bacterium]
MFEPMSLQGLAELDSERTLVLTVNNRYARRILGALSAQLGHQRGVIAIPDIMPLSAWLRQVADDMAFDPQAPLAAHLLDALAARAVWQQAIEAVETETVLLDVAQAARLAQEADQLLSDWELTIDPSEASDDYLRFEVWRQAYEERLIKLDAQDANRLSDDVCQWFAQTDMPLAFDNLVVAGFNEIAPRLLRLFEEFRSQGIVLYQLEMPSQTAERVHRISVPEPDAEWRLAAQWAAQKIAANPQGRYAIIAPQLESDVAFVHRVLETELAVDTQQTAQQLYNVAVARPLAEWPVVRAGLAWLQLAVELLNQQKCRPETAGQALLAGHCVADAAEAAARASLDAHWRHQQFVHLDGPQLQQFFSDAVPQLHGAWQNAFRFLRSQAGAQSLNAWAACFQGFLQQLGFPGETAIDSARYQTLEAFDQLFLRFEQQAPVFGETTMGQALLWLKQLALQTLFQPQAAASARLDVQGFLEAEGGRWDAVWVLGLSDSVLPATVKPNPFIPLSAQRRANTPRSTPERELQWAQALFQALLETAPEVYLSHAERDGEELLYPSPLISHYPLTPLIAEAERSLPSALARVFDDQPSIEVFVDDRGPAISDAHRTRGGSGVIDTQARNPLWAFVKFRLRAVALPSYADLFADNARGLFLHDCLEHLFKHFANQADLQDVLEQPEHLMRLLDSAIEAAANDHLRSYSEVLQRLEVERAQRLIPEWLALEAQRPPFRVFALEHSLSWAYKALDLRLRVDRIDQLSDGDLAVIDYKTGAGRPSLKRDWMRPRPINLQLPLYAVALAETQPEHVVAALVFAHVHFRNLNVFGLAADDHVFGGLNRPSEWAEFLGDWPSWLSHWQTVVHGLADEFIDGQASNQILDENDLAYCDVLPFLRLGDQTLSSNFFSNDQSQP